MSEIVKRLLENHSMQNGDLDSIIAYAEYSNGVRRKAAAEIERLEAENARLSTALENARKDAWQPIETAPKDGRLLFVMQGMDGGEKWVEQYDANQLTYPGIKDYATHWQPLPEPPSLTPPKEKAT